MPVLDRVKSFFSRRELPLTEASSWRAVTGVSASGETVTEGSALALSTVWACVRLISGTCGSLPMEVRVKHEGGHSVVDPKHSLHRILHDSPNADQTALDFWEFTAASLELQGDAISRRIYDGSRLIALVPARASAVDRRRISDGSIRYRWTEDKQTFDLSEDQVLHIRGFGGSPLGGLSTLRFARNSFGLAQAIDLSAGSVFKNSLRPSGALKFKEFLTPEQRDIANTKLASKIGAENTGKPLVLEGDATWVPLTINPDDAQMLEARRFSVEEICRFIGVPPHMVGHTEKSTSWGKGLEQQTLSFVMYTLRSRLKRIEMAAEQQLLTSADRARGVSIKFNLEGLLRGDSAGRAAFYGSGLDKGWLTINEVRAKEGLPPVPGGDVPRMQMQNVPITEAGNDLS